MKILMPPYVLVFALLSVHSCMKFDQAVKRKDEVVASLRFLECGSFIALAATGPLVFSGLRRRRLRRELTGLGLPPADDPRWVLLAGSQFHLDGFCLGGKTLTYQDRTLTDDELWCEGYWHEIHRHSARREAAVRKGEMEENRRLVRQTHLARKFIAEESDVIKPPKATPFR